MNNTFQDRLVKLLLIWVLLFGGFEVALQALKAGSAFYHQVIKKDHVIRTPINFNPALFRSCEGYDLLRVTAAIRKATKPTAVHQELI